MSILTRRSLIVSFAAAAQAAAQEIRAEKSVFVGDTRVRLLIADEKPRKSQQYLIYFHPHENEHGSAVIARHQVREHGGRLLEIRSQGDRLITFRLQGVTYSFDPNHMFTDVGLRRSLTHYGPYSPAALECAKAPRNLVVSQLSKGRIPIVAVHNNAEDGVNALSYQKGGQFEAQAIKVALNPREKAHNFFLVLDDHLFSKLHHAGFNTVLQSPNSPDDGSLAVFCQQRNWPFINVEASDADMMQQQRMLQALPAALA